MHTIKLSKKQRKVIGEFERCDNCKTTAGKVGKLTSDKNP